MPRSGSGGRWLGQLADLFQSATRVRMPPWMGGRVTFVWCNVDWCKHHRTTVLGQAFCGREEISIDADFDNRIAYCLELVE
jgi:hypothetical protein